MLFLDICYIDAEFREMDRQSFEGRKKKQQVTKE